MNKTSINILLHGALLVWLVASYEVLYMAMLELWCLAYGIFM